MSFKIHIENFQSIVKADLEVSGLTTITGQNNTGKSAIMRAFRAVFTNPPGSHYIHHGKDHVRVRIDFEDSYVVWEKVGRRPTKGKNRGKLTNVKTNYIVNGKEFNGVSNTVPEEVLSLGVSPIPVGRDMVWPQIARAVKDVFFLIDQPGYSVAEAISDVERVGILNHALRGCDRETRSTSATLKVRREDQRVLSDRIDSFKGLDDILKEICVVEDMGAKIGRVSAGLDMVSSLRDRLSSAISERLRLLPVLEIGPPGDGLVLECAGVLDQLNDARRMNFILANSKRKIDIIGGAVSVEVPADAEVVGLGRVQTTVESLSSRRDRLKAAKASCERLSEIVAVDAVEDSVLSKMERIVDVLETATALRSRLLRSKKSVSRLKEMCDDEELRARQVRDELNRFEREFPKCPECGQFILTSEHAQ